MTTTKQSVHILLGTLHIQGLAQDCSNSSALAMELLQSCAKPSTYTCMNWGWHNDRMSTCPWIFNFPSVIFFSETHCSLGEVIIHQRYYEYTILVNTGSGTKVQCQLLTDKIPCRNTAMNSLTMNLKIHLRIIFSNDSHISQDPVS